MTFYSSPDGSVRRNIEDKLASKLRRLGVAATPSYAVVDPAMAIDAMRTALQAAGYDGIVAMRSIGDGAAFPTTTDTNYVYTDVVVRIETAVYSVSDGKMLWSALSRTVDPERASRVIDEVTTLVARDLGRQGVFVATLH